MLLRRANGRKRSKEGKQSSPSEEGEPAPRQKLKGAAPATGPCFTSPAGARRRAAAAAALPRHSSSLLPTRPVPGEASPRPQAQMCLETGQPTRGASWGETGEGPVAAVPRVWNRLVSLLRPLFSLPMGSKRTGNGFLKASLWDLAA